MYLEIFQVRDGVPIGHYCIQAAWPRHPRALSNHNIDPNTDIKDEGTKKHTRQKFQVTHRGARQGVYLEIIQVRDGVPIGHYCIQAAWPRHPRALSNHSIGPHPDIKDEGTKKKNTKNFKMTHRGARQGVYLEIFLDIED